MNSAQAQNEGVWLHIRSAALTTNHALSQLAAAHPPRPGTDTCGSQAKLKATHTTTQKLKE
jgi:hypothetical protein